MDSPYRGPITQKISPFDDSIMLCVFKLGTETFSGYVRHPREQYHLSHDRELMFVTSVTNIPKCLMLITLGTHLVVFVKLEELHIATARKPLFHQTQPVECYQHRNQPCML